TNLPAASGAIAHVAVVASAMAVQPVGAAAAALGTVAEHRYHAYDRVGAGAPDQVPSLTVRVAPTVASPETPGATEFVGVPTTLTVETDHFVAVPAMLRAVT